jgi:16S rRNA (guanine966-N2)-methyltransferase
MRIAGGEFKGRLIKTPKCANLRPSTQKTREAIFSSLGQDVIGARVADLFCGSGALGLEALSRGASHAIFVDSSHIATATVRENIRLLGLDSRAKAVSMNVFHLRPRHFATVEIIFADPPYRLGYPERLTALLSLPKFSYRGILVLEHECEWRYAGSYFKPLREISSGDSMASILVSSRGGEAHGDGGERKGNVE